LVALRRDLLGDSGDGWLLGHAVEHLTELTAGAPGFKQRRGGATDWPGARAIGRIATDPTILDAPTPEYLRDADAVLPNLPPSPLNQPLEVSKAHE
jgi:hypothetical protein